MHYASVLSGAAQKSVEDQGSDLTPLLFQTNEAGIWGLTASTWMTSQIWTLKWLPCIFPKSKISFYSLCHFLCWSV